MATIIGAIFSGLWKKLAMMVAMWVAVAKAKEAGKTEANAEQLKRDNDAAKRVAEAGATARPAPDALPERLRRNDW